MFAVFKNGGKQYKVFENQILELEKINADLGQQIELNEIMLISDAEEKIHVGVPHVAGASVKLEIVGQEKSEKVIIFKKRRRKNYRRKNGHRQPISIVKVISVDFKK